jgi:hypothetical protein
MHVQIDMDKRVVPERRATYSGDLVLIHLTSGLSPDKGIFRVFRDMHSYNSFTAPSTYLTLAAARQHK